MPSTCEYFKIEEKNPPGDPENYDFDEDVSQVFPDGQCTHENCKEFRVDCYGMIELCQVPDPPGIS